MLKGEDENIEECLSSLDACNYIYKASKLPPDLQEKRIQLLVHVFDSQIYNKVLAYDEIGAASPDDEWEKISQHAKLIWSQNVEKVDNIERDLELLRKLSVKSIHSRIMKPQSKVSLAR
jgi:hypothetical protein